MNTIETPEVMPPPVDMPEKKKMKTWVIILIVLVVLCCCCTAVGLGLYYSWDAIVSLFNSL
jgi:hypothetical protein